ncbi:MAG TPA: Smr/MutS family protein [Defluviitoga sp.]|nr:Smr/MutS family protein [Defluviitoga sp.]HOP24384.1 Smr/MutS family protein [Defluviitoga sp.]HPZ28626.1 Smr/MutS family protein [Defluviitoga sp.]
MLYNTEFYYNFEDLEKEIKISNLFLDLVMEGKVKELYGINYISNILEKVEKQESLEGIEFRNIGEFLEFSNKIYQYYSKVDELLAEKIRYFDPLNEIREKLLKVFAQDGNIKDEATVELKNIRKGISIVKNQINIEFNRIKNRYYKYLSIDQPIERNDRICVAVKSENRNQIKGISVGKSDSGSTIFIEPESLIELNERYIDLVSDERLEINRIISLLTFELQRNINKLKQDVAIISYIDSNIAKVKYAKANNAIFVLPNRTSRNVKLKELRHPLIDKEKVVPIDVELNRNGMIITGPNTGGKTVTLKSIGVAFFMSHAALPVLSITAEIPYINNIYTDIGDQQNIAENLSTFSAHLVNIKKILDEANENSLVLIDELGTGTDPIEGAALSKAILKYLLDKGPLIFATSHLSEIKVYSLEEARLLSASMSFDSETLQPTYKLLVGVPGASHAIEIAHRLGINSQVIQEAYNNLDKGYAQNEKILRQLTLMHKEYEESLVIQKQAEEKALKLKKEYDEKVEKLRKKELEDIDREIWKIKEELKKIKNEVQKIISEIKIAVEGNDLEAMQVKLQQIEKLTLQLDSVGKQLVYEKSKNNMSNLHLNVGMVVKVPGNLVGEIKKIEGSKVTVQLKDSPIQITYSPKDIELLGKENEETIKTNVQVKIEKKELVNPELDIRGLTVNEAIPEIKRFIDELIAAGITEGRIIHGKGSGKLALGVWEYLRNSSIVKDFKIAKTEEGGTGVTVIEL